MEINLMKEIRQFVSNRLYPLYPDWIKEYLNPNKHREMGRIDAPNTPYNGAFMGLAEGLEPKWCSHEGLRVSVLDTSLFL